MSCSSVSEKVGVFMENTSNERIKQVNSLMERGIIAYLHENQTKLCDNMEHDGIAVYQLASIATVFWSAVFDNYIEEIQKWPWYQYVTSIRNVYKYVEPYRLGYDLIYLCSNEFETMSKAENALKNMGGEHYEIFDNWTEFIC